MKAFIDNVWNRVVGGYKSTLTGLGFAALVIILDAGTDYLNGLPQGWAKAAAAIIVLASASLKPKALPPTP
jgi:hypothetical protein